MLRETLSLAKQQTCLTQERQRERFARNTIPDLSSRDTLKSFLILTALQQARRGQSENSGSIQTLLYKHYGGPAVGTASVLFNSIIAPLHSRHPGIKPHKNLLLKNSWFSWWRPWTKSAILELGCSCEIVGDQFQGLTLKPQDLVNLNLWGRSLWIIWKFSRWCYWLAGFRGKCSIFLQR